MNTNHNYINEEERITCEICMKEVPVNEATVPEAADYIIYFCGLECYEKWKSQQEDINTQIRKTGS